MIILYYNMTDGMDSAYAQIWNRRSLSKCMHSNLNPQGMGHSAAGGYGTCLVRSHNSSANSDNVPFNSLSRGKHSSFAGPDVDWELV